MMTLEELTSWRVAAIEGKLPEPVRSGRWQPLRAGVVNLWEYDTAEVWYADGRMQLQGANESGKSTLMTLTTLLLLAGEVTSHNIDTLGQNDKRFRYYVEPTSHPLDRRDTSAQKSRGWAWLEFGRGAQAGREADFFTVLLFAEARRADTNMRSAPKKPSPCASPTATCPAPGGACSGWPRPHPGPSPPGLATAPAMNSAGSSTGRTDRSGWSRPLRCSSTCSARTTPPTALHPTAGCSGEPAAARSADRSTAVRGSPPASSPSGLS